MRPLKIVHISDIHVKESDDPIYEIKARLTAFLNDVEEICQVPDFLVVSGDLAFSGKTEEYNHVEELIFKPFLSRFKLDSKRIIICMGNHDVNRSEVDKVIRDGVLTQLEKSGNGEYSVPYQKYSQCLSSFSQCAMQYSLGGNNLFGTSIFTINGIKVGFVSYNSALVCFDLDVQKGDLYLTKEQIRAIPDELESCAIRIGVMHHPLEWLNEKEKNVVIPDLKNKTPILLTGHMHDEVSYMISSPDCCSLLFTTTSFFSGQDHSADHSDGYSIYTIDVESSKVEVKYRSYIRNRHEYAPNCVHAAGGVWKVTLNRSVFKGQSDLSMVAEKGVEKLSETETKIVQLIKDNARISQCEISNRLGKTRVCVGRCMQKLLARGVIKRVGTCRDCTWELMK